MAETQTKDPAPLIDAKQAVIAAANYFTQVTGNTSGVTVEEIEREGDVWLVTLGFYPPAIPSTPFSLAPATKAFKVFRVDATSGEVLSMKIREP